MSALPLPKAASFDSNASSTRRASVAVKLFLAPRTQAAVGCQLVMFTHPAREGRWRDLVAVARLQFGYDLGKGIAEIVRDNAIENDAERVRLIS